MILRYDRLSRHPGVLKAMTGLSPKEFDTLAEDLIPASVAVQSTTGAPAGPSVTPLLDDRTLVGGLPTAYVCERFACRLPVTTPEDLRTEIDAALALRT